MNAPEDTPTEPEVVLWAEYPSGQYQAAVQTDGRSVYFLIQTADSEAPPRLTWVRNLVPGPLVFPRQQAEAGRPPLMPESYNRHPAGQPAPDWDACRILWFPQGLGAALMENDQLLALIPPLPDQGLPGFSHDCLHPSPVALPLEDDDLYQPLVPLLGPYWEMWAHRSPWPAWQIAVQKAWEPAFGPLQQRYAAAENQWPPIGIQKFRHAATWVISTVGMGLRPQIGVEKDIQNFREHQQIELAVAFPNKDFVDESQLDHGVQWLAGLARYPWFHQTCFLPGHTISIPPELSEWFGSTTARFASEREVVSHQQRSEIQLPAFASQPVNLLWLVPSPQHPE